MDFRPDEVEFTRVEELPEELKDKKNKKSDKKPKKASKKRYAKGRYSKNPVTILINKTVTEGINTTLLKNKEKKLLPTDSEIGEATFYMVEYYTALDIHHPALVIFSAVLGLSMLTMQYMNEEDAGKPRTKTKDDKVSITEVAE